MNLPDRRYSIIYADPPWKYRGTCNTGAGNPLATGAHTHYPTVHLDDLKAMPIASIMEPDCLLFMWATGPKLDWALQLGEAWGMRYVTVGFVWDKVLTNPGYYTMSQCEVCLIFKRGRIPQPRGVRNARQFHSIQREEHSAKPYRFRQRIADMFPTQSKIELFARSRHVGWDAWGLESDSRLDDSSRIARESASRVMKPGD